MRPVDIASVALCLAALVGGIFWATKPDPQWVAAYPGGKVLSQFEVPGESAEHVVVSQDSPADVYTYYRTRHLASGWSVDGEYTQPDGERKARFVRYGYTASLSVKPISGGLTRASISGHRNIVYDQGTPNPGLK